MLAQIQGFGRQFIVELIRYQHSQIPEKTLNMLCAMIIANTQILNPVRLMKNINFHTDLDEIYLLVFTTKV